jgi:hypothetical protein
MAKARLHRRYTPRAGFKIDKMPCSHQRELAARILNDAGFIAHFPPHVARDLASPTDAAVVHALHEVRRTEDLYAGPGGEDARKAAREASRLRVERHRVESSLREMGFDSSPPSGTVRKRSSKKKPRKNRLRE